MMRLFFVFFCLPLAVGVINFAEFEEKGWSLLVERITHFTHGSPYSSPAMIKLFQNGSNLERLLYMTLVSQQCSDLGFRVKPSSRHSSSRLKVCEKKPNNVTTIRIYNQRLVPPLAVVTRFVPLTSFAL